MLQEIAKTYFVRDVAEEFCLCGIYPVQGGWEVTEWKTDEAGPIPMPDFTKSFGLVASKVGGDRAEKLANCILGKESMKEFKEDRRLLEPQRRNRVFNFFQKAAPICTASLGVASRDVVPRVEAVKKEMAAKGSQGGGVAVQIPASVKRRRQQCWPRYLTVRWLLLERPSRRQGMRVRPRFLSKLAPSRLFPSGRSPLMPIWR